MERWPPVYDAEELAAQIRDLAGARDLEDRFFTTRPNLTLCQGDIFQIESPIPLIDEAGDAVAVDDITYWMATGNTCDFARPVSAVAWTQLVPVLDLGHESDVSQGELQDLRQYKPFRRFYVPAWKSDLKGTILMADLTRPVAAHKQAIENVATLEARLTEQAWILFHSCLVRFLARDDGRFD